MKNFAYMPKKLRPAFTIIEILISVIIISTSIIYVLKLHTSNHKQIVYISERNKRSLEDSLYLTKNILQHHQDTKTAQELLRDFVKIKETDSRELLKDSQRSIFIPEEILIFPPPNIAGPTATVNEVKLKDKHSSIYWHFEITSL
ncbi:MAG: hypothetical protein Q9M36_15790 [Sulfurovum sp.]|nr:hypothetical protein [Sulfurovum sp.]